MSLGKMMFVKTTRPTQENLPMIRSQVICNVARHYSIPRSMSEAYVGVTSIDQDARNGTIKLGAREREIQSQGLFCQVRLPCT